MSNTRAEHLQWCKDRANEYVDRGDLNNAMTSFMSDMGNHLETAEHSAINLGIMLKMGGHLESESQMRNWIDGFN